MPFTETQKHEFIERLENKGWRLNEGVIESPNKGLYFNDSHFMHWTPSEMHEVFSARALRIEKAKIGNWKSSSAENREVALTAALVSGNENEA